MSSGGDRKRGHDAVSDETDTSARLTRTKQLKPPPAPPSAEPRPLCFLDLPAGIVANIAQFIDIDEADDEGNSVRAGDILMYLCLVFGRQTARVIRREYLSNNLSYLGFLYSEILHHCEQNGTRQKLCMEDISNLNGALEQWMHENKWWKDACRDAAVFANGGDVRTKSPTINRASGIKIANLCTKYPTIYKTVELEGFADDGEEKTQWSEAFGTGRSSLVDLYFEGGPLGDDYTIVLAVDDIDLMNHNKDMTWDQVEEAILKEGDKKLRVMHSDFAALFLNPALAIDLGMLELFRFQVEDLMLDMNCQDYIGLFFARVPVDDDVDLLGGQPLLLHTLINPDKRFFEYLLSVADFEANPIIKRDLEHGGDTGFLRSTFLHRLPRIIRCDLPNKIDLDWVAQLIKVKEVDLEVQSVEGWNPLETLCSSESLTKSEYDVAKMLLSAGAEVNERVSQNVRFFLKGSSSNDEVPRKVFLELLESHKE